MRVHRPSALMALVSASAVCALPAAAKPPVEAPPPTPVSIDGSAMPILFASDSPTSVSASLLANAAGRPVGIGAMAGGGLRGTCPELVSVDGALDGDMPFDVAFYPDGSTAVIVHPDSDNVTYLDIATRTVTGGTAVGDFPVHAAVTPDGRYILTANVFSNSVSVIDAATRLPVTTIPVTGTEPYRIAVTSDSSLAVVGVINDAANATFSVIDLNTLTEIRSFPGGSQGVYGGFANSVFPIFGNTFGTFALAPDNQTIVLPASGVPAMASTVFFFDITTGAQTNAVVGPTGARSVDISADGTLAAVGYLGNSNRIDIFDMATQSVSATVPTSTNLDPFLRFSPDASKLITGYLNDTFIIDRATSAEIFRTQTGTIGDIEITHDGSYVVVPNFTTRVIDLASPAVVAAVSHAPTSDMAVSPVAHVAVGLNNRFGEDAHVYSTNGPSSSLLASVLSGPLVEGDAPFDIDISADGQTAIVGLTLSYNVAILDVPSRTVRAHIDTGKRVMDVAITPDGTHAVSCDGDSNRVSIIDLATDTVVKQIPIFTRPAQVRISPDSSTAYVLNLAGTDQITFINLDGADSSVLGTTPAGQTGSWSGAQYGENSDIRLSPDGSLLAVCDSFNDFLLLIDTATRTQVAAVPVGDFPMRVAFSPDGTRAYVTNVFGDSLSVVSVNGAASSTIATVPIGDNALTVSVDGDGSHVYVTDYTFFGSGSSLYVVDTATFAVVNTIPLDGRNARDAHYEAGEDVLYIAALASSAAGSTPALYRVNAAGPSTSVIDATPLSGNTYDLAYSGASGVAVMGQPFLDAIDFICFGDACPADWSDDGIVNSSDISAFLTSWLASVTAPNLDADFNNDGATNSSDISAFLTAWLDAVVNGC